MNSNHKSISSRTKNPVLGLILGAREMRLIPYFSALLLTQSPLLSLSVLLNCWSYGKITYTSLFFKLLLLTWNLILYQEGIWYTWPSATYRKWGDPWWHVLLKLKFTCLWLRTLNTWLVLTCLLYPNCMFHGRCKQSVSGLIPKPRNILWAWANSRWNKAKKNCAVVGWVEIQTPFENLRFFVLQAEDDFNHLAFHHQYRANISDVIRSVFWS